MREFVIMTEASSDVTAQLAERFGIYYVIPSSFTLNGKVLCESPTHRDIEITDFYDEIRKKAVVHTSAIIPQQVETALNEVLSQDKDILYLSFSSGLSNTYQNVLIAHSQLDPQLQNRVKIVDTKMASLGEVLLAHYCNEMRKSGKTLEETYNWATENATKIVANFTVDNLFHLKRGGRISAATAIAGSALGIKPILNVDNEGHLHNDSKTRGRKASLDEIVKRTLEMRVPNENEVIIVGHGDCLDDAEYVRNKILAATNLDSNNVIVEYIGATIGSHSGPGTMATFILAKER